MKNTKLGEIIRLLRKSKDLSQDEFSKILGIDQRTLSGYETGNSEPDIETINTIADYFKVTTDFLTGRSIDNYYMAIKIAEEEKLSPEDTKDLIEIATRKRKKQE